MTPQPISAIDSISPALHTATQQMFKPFQWAKWWRIGLLGLATGEVASGGGCNIPSSGGGDWGQIFKGIHPNSSSHFLGSSPFPALSTPQIVSIISVLVIGIFALGIVHMYIGSVLRFVLFEAVANGRYRIREGWRRWNAHGFRYFLFQIAIALISLAGIFLIASPIIIAAVLGSFKSASPNVWLIVLGLLVLIPIFLLFILCVAIVHLLAKDFAVPIMALEGVGPLEALLRVWGMVKNEKGDYAGYVGMKIVLAIAYAIGFAIIQFMLVVVMLVPVLIGIFAARSSLMNILSHPLLLAGIITGAIFGIFVLIAIASIVAAPAVVFFQSYVLTFFSTRYLPLWKMMHPEPPSAPQEIVPPPDMPPLPEMS